ncbi:cyclase [Halobacteriales archaeon QS_4_62_28]|nr:MAG: cyclase [Halobacteriales archaeon QS_4_62_28]
MSVYERSVRVDAPLERVWDFHSKGSGLEALTPDWMNLVIEESRGPDGEPDPEILEAGAVIVSSVRPFGVGPRQNWTSEIVTREEGDDHAMFRDLMTDGPFRHWEHTHRFVADGDATLVHDRVEYQFPGGSLGKAIGPFAYVGFEPMFRFRHRKTRELLE